MRVNLALPFAEETADLRDRISTVLTTLAARLRGVQEVAAISGTSSATLTEVTHSLGATPDYIHVEPVSQVRWWVTTSDRAQWTSSKVYLHFESASVNFVGYVSRLEQ